MGTFSSVLKPRADKSMFRCSRAAGPEPLRVGVAVPLVVPVLLVLFTTFGDIGVGNIARFAALDATCASAAFF